MSERGEARPGPRKRGTQRASSREVDDASESDAMLTFVGTRVSGHANSEESESHDTYAYAAVDDEGDARVPRPDV